MGIKGASIPPIIDTLLQEAEDRGVKAAYVEIETFDAVMLRLWRNLDGKSDALDAKVRKSALASVSIPLPAIGSGKPIVRFNALPVVSMPLQCLKLGLKQPLNWHDLRQKQANSNGNLICTKDEQIWCWGQEAQIRTAFGQDLLSITPHDIPPDFHETGSLHAIAFIEDALCRALARNKPLLPRKMPHATWIIANPNAIDAPLLSGLNDVAGAVSGKVEELFTPVTEEHPQSEQVTWAEGVRITIDIRDRKTWLLIEPDIWIWPVRARKIASDFLDKRRSDRFNKKYNALLDVWVPLLLGNDENQEIVTVFSFDAGNTIENPAFEIGTHTAYSRRLIA